MKRRTAVVAVGPSALRGQGPGVLRATQNILNQIDLLKIPKGSENQFTKWLDNQTEMILGALPVRNKPWGTARKALNLFLRDVLYNRYLCDIYRMQEIECWLEVPLDSAVAKGLKKKAGRGKLPPWPGLKKLNKDVSNEFQAYASNLADKSEMKRVHLDIYLWLENR